MVVGANKAADDKMAASVAAAGRPYATDPAELNRPHIPGESAAEKKKAAEGWRWIVLALATLAVVFGYTRGWPAVQHALYTPSPLRDYLLPASADPVHVIAGVGVGWFWILFVAAPAGLLGLSVLWWLGLAAANRRARAGYRGTARPGHEWVGETHPTWPMILSGAAALLASAGVLMRWAEPALATLPGRLLVVALLAVGTCGFVQFVRWAQSRSAITQHMNQVTFLASPTLGWPDLRAGRVRAKQRRYPRSQRAFAARITLLYAQHPRFIGDDITAEITTILHQVTGHTYALEHDPLTRSLTATETEVVTQDPILDAEAVLAPLVANWFDAAATLASVTVGDPEEPRKALVDLSKADDDLAVRSAATDSDAIAARIREFTVGYVYNQKVSSGYRRGQIEGMVSDALGGSWEAEWSVVSRRVRFVRAPGLPTMVDPPLNFPEVTRSAVRALYKQTAIPFAVDAYGNHIVWDFKQSPHFLIAGATSTGKTSALMTIGTQCARRGFNVVWIDPKGFDSPGMRDWPNVSLVTAGTDEDGLVGHTAALRFLADTMTDRLSQVKINPNRADDFDPIIVLTDEFSNLVVALGDFYNTYKAKGERGAPPTARDVGILLRTARAVAIHMAIGIQRPDTMFISGEARDNTAMRVAMGRLRSKDAAIMMFQDPVAGTRLQPGIKGRGTAQLPDGSFREIQAFYTPKVPATDEQRSAQSDHERAILSELSRVDSFWPRRVVDSALRGYDPEDDSTPMSFKLIRDSPIVLASERPDLDPLSERYVPPVGALRKPTMDDDHPDPDMADEHPISASSNAADDGGQLSAFGGPVDGYDDAYMPTVDDEYGPPVPVAANELQHGDLVDVSVDGVSDWKYVHAEPYQIDDDEGVGRLVIPYRDLDDGHNAGDIEVDPYEVLEARQLSMQ